MQADGVEEESGDEAGDGDDREDPSSSDRGPQVSREEELPEQDQEEADQEQDEVFGHLAGPDQLDHELHREQHQKADADQREPYPDAADACPCNQLAQPPQREGQCDETAGANRSPKRLRLVEHELTALPDE